MYQNEIRLFPMKRRKELTEDQGFRLPRELIDIAKDYLGYAAYGHGSPDGNLHLTRRTKCISDVKYLRNPKNPFSQEGSRNLRKTTRDIIKWVHDRFSKTTVLEFESIDGGWIKTSTQDFTLGGRKYSTLEFIPFN